jgi:hypothetical protein
LSFGTIGMRHGHRSRAKADASIHGSAEPARPISSATIFRLGSSTT